jgi:DNA-binding GntR family transcriptional regulator
MESGRMESGRGARNPQGAEDPMFRPRRFAEDVVTILRQMILSGELAAGERINEIKLADRLKISRSPIREAMQTLAGEGLVISVSGRGAFVASFDMEAVDHLLEVRATLECAAARFATVRADDASLDELEAFLMRTKDALGDTGHPYPRDLDFHEQVVAMSGNPKLMDTVRGVTTQYAPRPPTPSTAASIRPCAHATPTPPPRRWPSTSKPRRPTSARCCEATAPKVIPPRKRELPHRRRSSEERDDDRRGETGRQRYAT